MYNHLLISLLCTITVMLIYLYCWITMTDETGDVGKSFWWPILLVKLIIKAIIALANGLVRAIKD